MRKRFTEDAKGERRAKKRKEKIGAAFRALARRRKEKGPCLES